MPSSTGALYAGIDAGTECIKAVVLRSDRTVAGVSIVPTTGYFQDCIARALKAALHEAKTTQDELAGACATGFASACAAMAPLTVTEAACHARAAHHYGGGPLTLLEIGGREPRAIVIDDNGLVVSSRSVRKCAVGVGTFLMFTARHLDVHPTRLMDLAANATQPASIGGYCSVFAEVEVIERLRDGVSAESIALGSMYAVADRILEISAFEGTMRATGGVCEYFPGVVRALAERMARPIDVLPAPITTGALGAALFALEAAEQQA